MEYGSELVCVLLVANLINLFVVNMSDEVILRVTVLVLKSVVRKNPVDWFPFIRRTKKSRKKKKQNSKISA